MAAAAAAVEAAAMLEDQIQEFREAFCLIDRNSDGFITVEELAMLIQTVDGHLKKQEENAGDELKEAFKVFDRDQDGFISPNELREVMIDMGERITEEEAEHMIRKTDFDGDDKVNYYKFIRMMFSFSLF